MILYYTILYYTIPYHTILYYNVCSRSSRCLLTTCHKEANVSLSPPLAGPNCLENITLDHSLAVSRDSKHPCQWVPRLMGT